MLLCRKVGRTRIGKRIRTKKILWNMNQKVNRVTPDPGVVIMIHKISCWWKLIIYPSPPTPPFFFLSEEFEMCKSRQNTVMSPIHICITLLWPVLTDPHSHSPPCILKRSQTSYHFTHKYFNIYISKRWWL